MVTERLNELLKFHKEDPADAFTLYAIATEYVNADQDSVAETWFARLMQDHPDYLGTYYHYGKLMERKGREDEAAKLYDKGMAVAKADGDKKTLGELAEAKEMLDLE